MSGQLVGMQRQSLLLDWVFYKRHSLCLPCVFHTISHILTTALEMHLNRFILALSALLASATA